MAEIKTERLCHVYSVGTPFEKAAIEGIDLTLPQGQLIGVIGHTGSGKSTFIQHLNALLQPTSGAVLCGGEDINKDKFTRKAIRFKVGLVFQYPEYQLFEETVYKDIAFGPTNMKISEEEIDSRVREAAGFTGIDGKLFERSRWSSQTGQKAAHSHRGRYRDAPGYSCSIRPTAGLDPCRLPADTGEPLRYREKDRRDGHHRQPQHGRCRAPAERILVFDKGARRHGRYAREVFSRPEAYRHRPTCRMRRRLAMALRRRGDVAAGEAYIRMSSSLPPSLV